MNMQKKYTAPQCRVAVLADEKALMAASEGINIDKTQEIKGTSDSFFEAKQGSFSEAADVND